MILETEASTEVAVPVQGVGWVTTDTPEPPKPHPQPHAGYFWEFVQFKVEGVLYQLPKLPFVVGSDTFATTHGISPLSTQGIKVIDLDVSTRDFEDFLKALPLPQLIQHDQPDLHLEPARWEAVLSLASQWKFNDLRRKAIQELTQTLNTNKPMNTLRMARQHGVREWLVSGLERLCDQLETLKENEIQEIGTDTFIKLSKIVIGRFRCSYSRPCLQDAIRKALSRELSVIDQQGRQYLSRDERSALEAKEKEEADEKSLADQKARQKLERERLELEENECRVRMQLAELEGNRKKIGEALELLNGGGEAGVVGKKSTGIKKKKKEWHG